jgi:hypothetical protein
MEPIGALSEGDGLVVVQRCTTCGHTWRNRVVRGDDREAVLALFGHPVPDATTPSRRASRHR